MEDIYFYLLLSLSLSIAAGICSSFSLWHKASSAGDSFAHFLSLAIVISVIFNLNISICLVGGLVGFIIMNRMLNNVSDVNNNLAIISSIGLATATIISSFYPSVRVDFMALLFGDIVAASYADILQIACFDILLLAVCWYMRKQIKLYLTNPEIAKVSGINLNLIELLITSSIMVFILIIIKIVGTIMMVGLIIFPAAIAKKFARSAEKMVLMSIVFALIGSSIGLCFSFYLDTPAGPAIILSLTAILVLSTLLPKRT